PHEQGELLAGRSAGRFGTPGGGEDEQEHEDGNGRATHGTPQGPRQPARTGLACKRYGVAGADLTAESQNVPKFVAEVARLPTAVPRPSRGSLATSAGLREKVTYLPLGFSPGGRISGGRGVGGSKLGPHHRSPAPGA